MGYTKMSGTPVITGLYTLLIPAALFAHGGEACARVWNASDEPVTVALHGRHNAGEAVSFRLAAE